ncbi:hypothetical protein LTS12_023907 [Elasticomyces elasticus]|nr:hypothetical protein LTS12_023907 [Elasticomyces elasticus]
MHETLQALQGHQRETGFVPARQASWYLATTTQAIIQAGAQAVYAASTAVTTCIREAAAVYAELKVLSVKLLDKTIQGEVHASHEDAAVTVLIYREVEEAIEAAQGPGGYIDAAEVVAIFAFGFEGYEALLEQALVDNEGNTDGAQAAEKMASSRFWV